MNANLIRGLIAAAALSAAIPAFAQPAPPPPAGDRGGPGRMDPAERAQMHAQKLRDVLQLRPNQEPALTELMQALKPPEDRRERMRAARAEMAGLTTPQRLDRMHEHMVRRQQEFDRKAMAIKKFYAQLSPAQQKAFDAMGPTMGHRMGGRMGGHGMRGRGHGGMGGGPGGPGMDHD
jgi:protein CpxP